MEPVGEEGLLPHQSSPAQLVGMAWAPCKYPPCFIGTLVEAAPPSLPFCWDRLLHKKRPVCITGLSGDCLGCEDTRIDDLISLLISRYWNHSIVLMQQNQQQTLLFQLWVSTGVCNQYEQIGQQETTAAIWAAFTRADPVCLPENSYKPSLGDSSESWQPWDRATLPLPHTLLALSLLRGWQGSWHSPASLRRSRHLSQLLGIYEDRDRVTCL